MKAIRFLFNSPLQFLQVFAAVTLIVAFDLFRRSCLMPGRLHFAVVADEADVNKKLLDSLGAIERKMGKVDEIEKAIGKNREDYDQVTKLVAEVQKEMLEVRKAQLTLRNLPRTKRENGVSDECARYLGAIVALAGVRGGQLDGARAEKAIGLFKDITGIEAKTALTSSDIPLPIGYSGDVAELVGMFGSARQYGTVIPLPEGVFKLPKLGTDTTFGLIAGSGTVTEKSPTVAWVTFTAEKFGGLVRMPSEIDEDSIVPMGQFLARYGARQLARAEDHNFWASTGAASGVNGTAEGLTKSVVTDSKTVALASGLLAPGEATLAKVRELRTKPDAAALRRGAYYCHPSWEQFFAGLNTAGDKPYQANGLGGATLDGFPIHWIDVLPVYSLVDAASTVFMLFGDVSFNYLGVRGGVRFDTSKEAGFTTDEILVRALERFTVGKMATGAVAGLITAAS
jgi:HK97 family phage major capsid protein